MMLARLSTVASIARRLPFVHTAMRKIRTDRRVECRSVGMLKCKLKRRYTTPADDAKFRLRRASSVRLRATLPRN